MGHQNHHNSMASKKARKKTLLFNLSRRIIKGGKRPGPKKDFIRGCKKGVPIALGYIPVGLAFGLLAKTSGFHLGEVAAFSFILYAGAAQFMCVDLMNGGVNPITIIISVFLLNLRLAVMSASIGIHTKSLNKRWLPLVGAMITDETFSILYFNKDQMTTAFTFGVELIAYLSWGIATIAGFFVGEVLPPSIQASFEVGLSCLFISLLIPSIKGQRENLWICIMAALIYLFIDYLGVLSLGWDIVASILISSFLGLKLVMKTRGRY
ncbi:MAG: AzlC family ABC transporter permease [Tissierellia bacterium]|nr:AzlC family ABC transporter permease [Tissierellia bacterium]